jgi:membrane protease YdiL (CAAX protease family)
MTARPRVAALRNPWLEPVLLLAGLAALVLVRAWATRAGLDALVVGAAFGIALAAMAVRGSRGLRLPGSVNVRSLAVGLVFGLVLVGLTAAGAAVGGSSFIPGLGRPAAPFLPWAAITVLVASAEEGLLRGPLFDASRRAAGIATALLVTTAAFSLMHVPMYGWHVVPLDLAVGLALGGLRLATGGVLAPAAAHTVADLATWWL